MYNLKASINIYTKLVMEKYDENTWKLVYKTTLKQT